MLSIPAYFGSGDSIQQKNYKKITQYKWQKKIKAKNTKVSTFHCFCSFPHSLWVHEIAVNTRGVMNHGICQFISQRPYFLLVFRVMKQSHTAVNIMFKAGYMITWLVNSALQRAGKDKAAEQRSRSNKGHSRRTNDSPQWLAAPAPRHRRVALKCVKKLIINVKS